MRLTLRTLLAYRDGVLSPAETSDLHLRIRQTEIASNLLRRIENLGRDKQLLAPKVSGTGLGGDANSVAEYLDDTLTSEQVPEFERICIAESDLVLAELAHCHRLLAEALNSQVNVPPGLKALAISLTNPQNQAALSRRLNIGGGRHSPATEPTGSIRRVNASHDRSLIHASDPQSDGENDSQRSQVQAPMVTSGGGSIKPQGLDLERPQLAHEVPEYLVGKRSVGGWRIPLAIGAMVALLGVLVWQALGPLKNVRDLFIAARVDASDSTSKGKNENTADPSSHEVEPNASKNVTDSASNSASPTIVAETDSSSTTQNADSGATHDGVAAKTGDASQQTAAPSSESTLPDIVAKTLRWTPGPDDMHTVLLARKSINGMASLNRLAANAPLPADAEIVVPPFMRSSLNFGGSCLWTVCGPTLMQPVQNENVMISTLLCKAFAKAGQQGQKLMVVAPAGSVELRFDDATSMAAVEAAFRPVSQGPITDKLAFKPLLVIVAVEGQVTVTPIRDDADSKSIRLGVGEGVAFVDSQPMAFELGAIPSWYRSANDRPLDLLAASDMHKWISGTVEVSEQLTAMAADRRPETAALAIQTSMLLGDWTGFTRDFLNNELMRSHWSSALELAEQLIASKDQSTEAIRTAFEAAHPGRGDGLIALLVGASDSSQPKEFLQKLVEVLGSGELDERVLAAHQLRRLTGKDMGFQPSFPNRAALQQWRRALASSLPLLPLDDPLWEAKKPAAE